MLAAADQHPRLAALDADHLAGDDIRLAHEIGDKGGGRGLVEVARRAGVQTATVAQDGEWSVVPSAALIYEKTGASIVFVSPKPLTYQRVKVVVARDDGTRSWLSIGPAAGDLVVTVGVNQVWGAEQGVGH